MQVTVRRIRLASRLDPERCIVYTLSIYRSYAMMGGMVMQTARLFRNGQSQAVRLPKEYRFEGDRVYIRRFGDAVVLLPCASPWQTLYESLNQFSDDFMDDRKQPDAAPRESLFE